MPHSKRSRISFTLHDGTYAKAWQEKRQVSGMVACLARLARLSTTLFASLLILITENCFDCSELKALPDGMDGLTSLEQLIIDSCPGINRFPQGLLQRLPALKSLTIVGCPDLQRRCREGGEYFELVSLIPDKMIYCAQKNSMKSRLLSWCVGGSSSSWGPYAHAPIYCTPIMYLVQFLTYSPPPFSLLCFFYSNWFATDTVEHILLYLNAFLSLISNYFRDWDFELSSMGRSAQYYPLHPSSFNCCRHFILLDSKVPFVNTNL